LRAIRHNGPIPRAILSLGAADATLGIRRPRPPHKLIPLPVSVVLHALILAVLIFAAHRALKPPPAQPAIAVVFEGTGLTKSATKTTAPRSSREGPPQRALDTAPPTPRPRIAPRNPTNRATLRHAAPPYRIMPGMSFGHGAAAPSPFHRMPGHLALQLSQSYLDHQSPAITFKGKAGPDWESAFNKWVNAHKYYPQAAADNQEQGKVTIAMTIMPDGSVRNLRLLSSSGAPLLDMAWLGLFQGGVHVPPFPPGSPAKQERVIATMHFKLIY
jgi:protein TonB